jgi:hypothetical protein
MQTYRAILKGNRLEWTDAEPTDLNAEQPVEVTIVNPQDPSGALARGRRMAQALERLAATNALEHIKDPVAWQRELRKDRPLPNRDE